MKRLWAVAAVLAAFAPTVLAAEFEVGRAKVELPGEGWRAIDMADGGKPYNGGVQDKIPSETKVFIKLGADKRVQTIALVRASQAGIANGWMSYSHQCKGDDQSYAEGNAGARTNNYDCLRVWGEYSASSMMEAFVPGIAAKLKQEQAPIPDGFEATMAHFANANGSFAEARVLFTTNFSGAPGAEITDLPKGVQASTVRWGQALAKSVRSSVSSLSGRLQIPAIEYQTNAVKTASN